MSGWMWAVILFWSTTSLVIALIGLRLVPRGAPMYLPINWPGARPQLPRNLALVVFVAMTAAMAGLGMYAAATAIRDGIPVLIMLWIVLPAPLPLAQVWASRQAAVDHAARREAEKTHPRFDPRTLATHDPSRGGHGANPPG
jgi:hypothetical protein